MSISEFYKSKARQRKWGTWCNKCKKQLERGDELMRRQDGRNQNNCMTYTEYCMECYEKILPSALKSEVKEIENEIVLKKEQLIEAKRRVKEKK
tara:strand:+ start:482 stop:763 length:282 start_codon:yes stop_codon:yes gene_type:complete